MRSCSSIVGPLILITVGFLFLAGTLNPHFSPADFFGQYWPFLLIFWGGIQFAEITARFLQSKPLPVNGVSAGAWMLVVLVCIAGFTIFEVRRPDNWWRRAGFDQGVEIFGDAHTYEIAPAHQHTAAAPRIILEHFRGNARIVGADTDQVELHGTKTVRALEKVDADRANSNTPVQLVAEGNTVIVRSNQGRATGRIRMITDLDLTVPRGASIEANGESGDFDLAHVNGDVEINTDQASLKLEDVGGDVHVETHRGGLIHCGNIKGAVVLRGHGSDVELERISGQVKLDGLFSGTVTVRDIARPLHIQNSRTEITAVRVPGEIRMERGAVSGQGLVGPIRIGGHSVDIELSGFSDGLELATDRGDVELRPGTANLGGMTVRTGSGNVELALPESAKFQLRATTDRGEIENEFGQPLALSSRGRGALLEGSVGVGPNLVINTDRGSITVRKGDVNADLRLPKPDAQVGAGHREPPEAPQPPSKPKPTAPPEHGQKEPIRL